MGSDYIIHKAVGKTMEVTFNTLEFGFIKKNKDTIVITTPITSSLKLINNLRGGH